MNDHNTIDAQLLDLMLRAGSRWVLWVLMLLSLGAITVIFERVWFYMQERAPKSQLDKMLLLLEANGADAALASLKDLRSMQASVARSCLEHAADGAGAVEEHKAAAVERERLRYEKRLAFLGTLGNNAPFVGLFGTVLGIIRAFHDLGGTTMQGMSAVMTGIGEALVATAVGLLVALPAVATYNAFMRHVEGATGLTESYAHQILAYIKTEPRAAAKEA